MNSFTKSRPLKIAMLAGEASGDLLGAKLIKALHDEYRHLKVEGIGGPAMINAGCQSLFDIERLSVMGFFEPLRRLPSLIKLRRELYRYFTKNRPDVFIGIDAPEFNIGLEYKIRRVGIPVVHYVSPSVWAWRQNRVHKIAKSVDLMLTLLPFEKIFYEKHNVPVKYVGHPLAEQIPINTDILAAKRALCLSANDTYIALLPGSRSQEIRYMAEPMLLAAYKVWQNHPHLKFITAHVNEQRYQEFYTYYQRLVPELPLEFFTRRSQDVLAAANLVIVTSGTATLEAMLYKKPMVIVYKMSSLTHYLAKLLVKTPYIGLPNLLANKKIVPELIQQEANPDTIAKYINDYLDHPEKVKQIEEQFTAIHETLKVESAVIMAKSIMNLIEPRKGVDSIA